MKRLILMVSFLWTVFGAVWAQEQKAWNMAVLSDIHIMAPELLQQDGRAFQQKLSYDRKMLRQSVDLLNVVVRELLASRPDVVLISGDLTKDGEAVSHRYVAQHLLRPLRQAGISVFVVPGNHDVRNPYATIMRGDSLLPTESVSPEEFVRCYEDYGYGRALARDKASLSYVVQWNDSVRVLAIDACRHDENNLEKGIGITAGRIKPETMDFIKEQALDARRKGCRLLGMMHHGLVRHWKWQDKVLSEYVVEEWKKQARQLASWGIHVVFTGHFHAQDITCYGRGKHKIYDIETGSTVSYPLPYRWVKVCGNQLHISTRYIRELQGFQSPKELELYAQQCAVVGLGSVARSILPGKVPDDVALQVGEVLGKAYLAHLAGDEQMPVNYAAELKQVYKNLRPYTWKYAFVLKKLAKYFYTDLYPADNEVVIELP